MSEQDDFVNAFSLSWQAGIILGEIEKKGYEVLDIHAVMDGIDWYKKTPLKYFIQVDLGVVIAADPFFSVVHPNINLAVDTEVLRERYMNRADLIEHYGSLEETMI